MAVKRNKKTRRGRRRQYQAVKGGPLRLRKESQAIALPAPNGDEEAHSAGVMRLDSGGLHLPEALAEAGENESNSLMPGRVVMIIVGLAIVFISIMAWFVSKMPEK